MSGPLALLGVSLRKQEAVVAKKRLRAAEEQTEESEVIPKGQLGDWGDKIPQEVQDAADEYVASLREANKAREQKNAAEDRCIAKMREHGVPRIRIDEGGKFLVCEDVIKLKTQKIKDPEA
jgi:hypothetical protein